jgi:F-type H+-transporting ATPase subunit epsilon
MKLDVVTQEGARVKGLEVDEITLPGIVGEMGILPGHKAMIMGLGIGPMTVHGPAGDERFALSGGFVEVLGDEINILSETCERSTEVDIERARHSLDVATAALEASHPGEGEAYVVKMASVRKARTRLDVAKAPSTVSSH